MNRNVKTLAAAAAGGVALVFLAKSISGGCVSAERYILADSRMKEAVSERFARAVSENHEPGKVVLIRFSGYLPATTKAQEIQVNAFVRGLRGGGWDVVELPPADLAEDAHINWTLRTSGGDWGHDLEEWLSPHDDAVAVVSLVGLPNLRKDTWKELPPWYAEVLDATPYYLTLLEQGFVRGLAIMKFDSDPVAIRKFRGPRDELFEMAYEFRSAPATP